MTFILSTILYFLIATTVICIENDKRDSGYSKKAVVVVEISLGDVAGLNIGPISTFLGIPFAEPPIDALRFRPPKPKRQWFPEVHEAFSFGPECFQSTGVEFMYVKVEMSLVAITL
jgi:hypothetical protein